MPSIPRRRLSASMFSQNSSCASSNSFALLGLMLAVVRIYGVVSYSVSQRTREIGLRMALGATSETVLRTILREGALLAGAGIVLGLAGSFAATRVLENYLFGVGPHDGTTFTAVSLLLL